MAASTIAKQYQCASQGGGFELVSVPRPQPGPDEVVFRTKAVALNPRDCKARRSGATVQSWPAVLGVDGAGIVEAVGENVKAFRPGDEILSFCTIYNRGGAFQELPAVPSIYVAKKPAKLTFEEAAALPACYLTALAAVTVGLQIPMPFLPSSDNNNNKAQPPSQSSGSNNIKSVLVLGGSSGVGAAAIQLLRLALPSATTIVATSSPRHHERLISLGATACLDRAAVTAAAIRAATPGGAGVDAILDAVGAAAAAAAQQQPDVSMSVFFDALRGDGPRLYAQVFTGDGGAAPPAGVKNAVVSCAQAFQGPAGAEVMPALARLVEEGRYEVPQALEVVGTGFEAIESGLDRLAGGVSGKKMIVRL